MKGGMNPVVCKNVQCVVDCGYHVVTVQLTKVGDYDVTLTNLEIYSRISYYILWHLLLFFLYYGICCTSSCSLALYFSAN